MRRAAAPEVDAAGSGPSDQGRRSPCGGAGLAAAVASAMALAFVVPFILGVLGPFIIEDLRLPDSSIGILVATSFAVAMVSSLMAGRIVDNASDRWLLPGLSLYCALAVVCVSVSPTYTWLLVAVGASGIAQAAANPVTNRLILDHVTASRRGFVMGVKQSGVQAGSFFAGLVLPAVALTRGWRGAVRVVALVALVVMLLSWRAVPTTSIPVHPPDFRRLGALPSGELRRLMAYVFFMGGGVAATTAYLPLYGQDGFGMGEPAAGALVAVLGATGIVARIAWAHRANRAGSVFPGLLTLAGGAAIFAMVIWQADDLGVWALWVGAAGLGATAVAQQSVSMLGVVNLTTGRPGQNTAMASMAFFAGFIGSPIACGVLLDNSAGYGPSWLLAVLQFTLAALAVLGARRSDVESDGATRGRVSGLPGQSIAAPP